MDVIGLTVDRLRIAVRVRSILYAMMRRSGLGAVARELEVSLESLQASVDLKAPHPSVEVLLAVIRRLDVDPTWLLTGEYDSGTHWESIEMAHRLNRASLPSPSTP